MNDECDCETCQDREFPCHGDCDSQNLCERCSQYREEMLDREHEEMVALGYKLNSEF